MKGIILAGGTGSRLYPLTKSISKQLLPVYDKPMIYYPISVLMLAGIKEILIISTLKDISSYKDLLGDGSNFGISISYAVQSKPRGIAEAFLIGEDFIGNDSVSLILGDNIFWGSGFSPLLKKAVKKKTGATLFGYQVKDPYRFGVVEFDSSNSVISIEEKPKLPKSNYAITGLYFYDNNVIEYAKKISPSGRGELEITTLNQIYLREGKISVELLGRGFAWLDTGTHESLLEASNFVETVQNRQGYKVACLEEIAWRNNWISTDTLKQACKVYGKVDYGLYLEQLYKEARQ